MKVENAKFEQYSRGQFLSMLNIITRYKTPYISKNIAKQLVASLFCVFTGFQQIETYNSVFELGEVFFQQDESPLKHTHIHTHAHMHA